LSDSQEFLRQLKEGAFSQVVVNQLGPSYRYRQSALGAIILGEIEEAIKDATCPSTLDAMISEEHCVECFITELRISPIK